MARALTAGELVHIRKDGQKCRLYLAFPGRAVIFTARVNGIPSTNDKVYQIDYDAGSADWADCISGMTVYVSPTSGGYSRGMARLRGTLSGVSGTMEIGETSEIEWTDDDYITVVDEFGLWPRHIRIDSGGVVYMDYSVAYSDQHANCDPVPVLGPHAPVWLLGATIDVDFDASDSWVVGSTISSYSWTATGASATSGMNTATPTITYDTAGEYRVSCVVTAANGKTFTGYRYVSIFDDAHPPTTVFQLDTCTGAWDGGGWAFRVTLEDEALRSEIRDRAMVVLFARDWYGSDETSIGPISDREGVIAVGWIAGESIEWDPEQGRVSFEAHGPHWWLNKMQGFPSGIEDYDGAPTTWIEFEDLTTDKGLWHFLHWRTTASLCMDFTLTGDGRQIPVFDAPPMTLWQQIVKESSETILATPVCDRYGRLFVQIDSQYMPTGDRGSIPIVHDLLKQDWLDRISFERRTLSEEGMRDHSGVAYTDGDATALFSLSPGHVFKQYGGVERLDRLALTSQAQSNLLCGLVMGNQNNEYPHVGISLASNHRMLDVCPHQYATITIALTDTERGIELTDFKLIPRSISFRHDPDSGVLLTDVEMEGYTTEAGSVTGDPPPEPPDPSVPPPPPPPPPPPEPPYYYGAIVMSLDQLAAALPLLNGAEPAWTDISTGITGTLHNVATNGAAAYVTTSDGLWHCVDIGNHAWTNIKTTAQAATDTGYDGYFGAIAIKSSGKFCALFHTDDGDRPSDLGPGAVYIGTGNTGTWYDLPDIGGVDLYQVQPNTGSNQAVSIDGDNFYICCGSGGFVARHPAVIHTVDGTSWTVIDFSAAVSMGGATQHIKAGRGGYAAESETGDVWQNWDPTNLYQAVSGIFASYGIHTEGTDVLYIRTAAQDLYKNQGTKVGDAEDVFGATLLGGVGQFKEGDDEAILWVVASAASEAAQDKIVCYTTDNGVTWLDKTGDLYTILGADWSGRTVGGVGLGNTICRLFEY